MKSSNLFLFVISIVINVVLFANTSRGKNTFPGFGNTEYYNVNIVPGEFNDLTPLLIINASDTVVFDFSQAVCTATQVSVPVFYLSDDMIYALDFELKFNPSEFTYNSYVSLKPYLNNSANYNTNDSTLRFSSFSMSPMDNNTPLLKLVFDVPSGQLNLASFSFVRCWLNGDLCSYKSINLPPAPPIVPAGITTIIAGDSLQLSISLPAGYTNLWSTGATTSSIWVHMANTYSVVVTNSLGCTASSFVTVIVNNPLPVEMVSFTGNLLKDKVELEWITASEVNNDFFTVEYTNNQNSWNTIATLDGAGTSNNLVRYKHSHKNPSQGINYYRLKQTDFDGNYKYSEIIFVNVNLRKSQSFKICPNPVSSGKIHLFIQIPEGDLKGYIIVSELSGRVVFRENIAVDCDNNTYCEIGKEVTLPDLAPGVYLVKWSDNYDSNTLKWIIQ